MTELRHTPLYEVQKQAGGRFVPFAGWEMAVQFAGVLAEHRAVRENAGVFDVSHMGELLVEGPGALDALQFVCTNDIGKLQDGSALYTVMCTENGGIVDDLIVYRQAAESYFICVNASRRQADFEHVRAHAAKFRCVVRDVSEDYAQLALQGPKSEALLAKLTKADLSQLRSFSFVDIEVAGQSTVRVARTGYTGEPGFELYCKPQVAAPLWRALMEVGQSEGLQPCGLGARDTLRLEMKFPLYGNDIDLDHNPLEAGLGWVVKFSKDFLGKKALEAIKAQGLQRTWCGFVMRERGIPRQGYDVLSDGKLVGKVTSGTHSPSLDVGIGTAYVPKTLGAPGTPLLIAIRDKQVRAEVVSTPFYKREKK